MSKGIPTVTVNGRLPRGRAGYDAIISAGTAKLAPDEWWVIDHDEGPLWETASKRLDEPVVTFCNALDCDWDEARESGFRLAVLKRLPN